MEFQKGDVVKATVELKSDDRECGIEDGTPIVAVGTRGVVIGRSEDHLEEGCTLKCGEGECFVVDWGVVNFDTHISEMELV